MNYRPSRANPYGWMRPVVKGDGFQYDEDVLCYVDDIIFISHVSSKTIEGIKAVFKLKEDKAEPPEMYLGAVFAGWRGRTQKLTWRICSPRTFLTARD